MKIFTHRRGMLAAGAVAVLLAAGCGTTITPAGTGTQPAKAMATVKVYFHKGSADGRLTPVTRVVPRSSDLPAAAMSQLLAGPTAAERKADYFSWFSGKTAGMLRSVRIAHGVGYADFRDFRLIISGASSSAGSALLLDELDPTLMQFPGVTETVYSFNGNVSDFYAWLQRSAPNLEPPGTAHAVDAARTFLGTIGMRALVTGTVRWAGAGAVDAQFRSDAGSGPVTTVRVQRQADGSWLPLSCQTPLIEVTQPTRLQAISSPVTIAGRSGTWEGQLLVSIRHYRQGTMTELDNNNTITGGATGMAPFSGQITFQAPPAGGTSWLVITYQSAKTGALAGVTAVQVRPAAVPPAAISSVQVSSGPQVQAGWLPLPAGAGKVTFTVRTSGAGRVQLFLVPTGTGTAPLAKLIGGAPTTGLCTLTWHYADQPVMAHLQVVATGPGGRAEQIPFSIMHPDAAGRAAAPAGAAIAGNGTARWLAYCTCLMSWVRRAASCRSPQVEA